MVRSRVRARRRRLAALPLAVAAILVTSVGAGASGTPVPWVATPVTAALIEALTPATVLAPVAKPTAATCTSADLTVAGVTSLQESQNVGVTIELRNVGASPCVARGRPVVTSAKSGYRTVKATSAPYPDSAAVTNTAPGATVRVQVSVPLVCASNPGGNTQGVPVYHQLLLAFPNGGSHRLTGLDFTFQCGMSVTPFFTERTVTEGPSPYEHLQASLSLPASATAGWLTYRVALRNPTATTARLDPCPAYVETVAGVKYEYRLNCATVTSLAAGSSVVYQMKIDVPSSVGPGPAAVSWRLIPPAADTATGTVTIASSRT